MSSLALRTVSAAILVPVALLVVWAGGWLFVCLCFIVAALVLREWRPLTRTPLDVAEALLLFTGLAVVAALCQFGLVGAALLLVVLMGAASALLPQPVSAWRAGGIVYAGLPLVALAALRTGGDDGLAAVVTLFAMVWATDIAAYAAGRLIGGPKIWPAISPSKTWAGLAGGIVAAAIVGAAAAIYMQAISLAPLVLLGALIAVVAQAGDFLESAVKRRFGAKDSGSAIPGHGGIMDRVDGLLAAAVFAALLGALRAGPELSAYGFLVW